MLTIFDIFDQFERISVMLNYEFKDFQLSLFKTIASV